MKIWPPEVVLFTIIPVDFLTPEHTGFKRGITEEKHATKI